MRRELSRERRSLTGEFARRLLTSNTSRSRAWLSAGAPEGCRVCCALSARGVPACLRQQHHYDRIGDCTPRCVGEGGQRRTADHRCRELRLFSEGVPGPALSVPRPTIRTGPSDVALGDGGRGAQGLLGDGGRGGQGLIGDGGRHLKASLVTAGRSKTTGTW